MKWHLHSRQTEDGDWMARVYNDDGHEAHRVYRPTREAAERQVTAYCRAVHGIEVDTTAAAFAAGKMETR